MKSNVFISSCLFVPTLWSISDINESSYSILSKNRKLLPSSEDPHKFPTTFIEYIERWLYFNLKQLIAHRLDENGSQKYRLLITRTEKFETLRSTNIFSPWQMNKLKIIMNSASLFWLKDWSFHSSWIDILSFSFWWSQSHHLHNQRE